MEDLSSEPNPRPLRRNPREVSSGAPLVGLILSGCGSGAGAPQTAVATSAAPVSAAPSDTSVGNGEPLLASGLGTVLDDGDGAELCLGGVRESLPPQCDGPRLIGWDWAEHAGDFEQRNGVRWGDFAVTGTYDGTDFTATDVVPDAGYQRTAVPEDDDQFATPCPEPDGGWIVDPDRVSDRDQDAAFRAAQRLEGYADSWVDTSRDRRTPEQMDQDAADGVEPGVSLWTVNVRVTGDPEAAEATLRRLWGGGLCVTEAAYTERELRTIQRELIGEVPDLLGGSVRDQRVEIDVIYDDGSLQAELDDRYGTGLVVVGSALTEVRR